MQNKMRYRIITATIIVIVATLLLIVVYKAESKDPFTEYTQVQSTEAFSIEESAYYVYLYKTDCDTCKNIEGTVKDFGKARSNMYFVNLDEDEKVIAPFDWKDFHTENDVEIGVFDTKQKESIYHEGESHEKYVNNNQLNENGKVKEYTIVIADDEYLEYNKRARRGYIYASLQTPDIDYSELTQDKEVIISDVPALVRVVDGKVNRVYIDTEEIENHIDKTNK